MNLDRMHLMKVEEIEKLLNNATKSNAKVFVYFKHVEDHNNNLKMDNLIAVDPSIIRASVTYPGQVTMNSSAPEDVVNDVFEQLPIVTYKYNANVVEYINSRYDKYILDINTLKEYVKELKEKERKIERKINLFNNRMP